MLYVERPGVVTTVQDLGRPGHYRLGIPPSGAADRRAHCVANWLVGNDERTATIEFTSQGPLLAVEEHPLVIAVCGAEVPLRINGEERACWTAHLVCPGDEIDVGLPAEEMRGYVAVSGGIRVAPRLDSRSTYLLGGLGGLEGRRLRAGDELPTGGASSSTDRDGLRVPSWLRPRPEQHRSVAMVAGLFNHLLNRASRAALHDEPWTLKVESDRVGYRLEGPKLRFRRRAQAVGAGSDPSNVVDAGYPVGSLMAPSGEEGIICMWDAVTAGGFATVGAVVRCELDRLAQARPGSTIQFRQVDLGEARRLRAQRRTQLERLRRALCSSDPTLSHCLHGAIADA